MRLSLAWACVVSVSVSSVVVVSSGVATAACSSDSGGSSGQPFVPEGGMITEDGAVVDMDGNVVEQDSSPPKPSKVDATNEKVDVFGTARDYVLVVPKTYDASRQYPLIVALHGDGGNAQGFRAELDFDDLAGDDAIAVYLEGSQDLGVGTPYDQVPDQVFVEATINAVKGKRSIDDAKIWGFGYSKGGFQLNQIACRKPGLLKAMAVHASGAPQEPAGGDGFPQCPGVVALPVLVTEGEFDGDIGGLYAANYWGKVGGCTTYNDPPRPLSCEPYAGCGAGKNVTFCRAAGVGHFPIWKQAAAMSWTFFKAL